MGYALHKMYGVQEALVSREQELINESHRREREVAAKAREIACPWPRCTKEKRRRDDGGHFAYCQEHINKSLDRFWNETADRIIRDAQ